MKSAILYFSLFALLFANGCSSRAVRPSTVASRVQFQETNQPDPQGERYYLLAFASQTVPKRPWHTHTWATMVKVTDRGTGDPPTVKHDTISWMPESLQIRVWRLHVQPGVNLDLFDSLEEAVKNRQRISMWGPYEVRPKAYRAFLIQKRFLDSGQIGYQAVDNIGEAGQKGNGCNCVHALSDIDALVNRNSFPVRQCGESATENIVKQMAERGALIEPAQMHDWLIPALRLEIYTIVRRN